MKPLLIFLCSFFVVTVFSQSKKMKVAHLENGVYQFDIDTTIIKNEWVKRTGTTNVTYQKIEVLKRQTFGEKKEDFYMLIAYDKAKDLKTCRYLIRINDSFYFGLFTDTTSEIETFYNTVFTCKGKNDVCFPEVLYMEGSYHWGGNQKLECNEDNNCTGTRSVIFTVY